ncbi:hypothetical protein [Stutzerimonas stutzeri]|uniref:hypothetical protein n=1 Tax=Stutzerimonas stutzeri TaxID=316 RepID=UPI0015E3DEB8|nr:hypothetical protein [Stutzerimonas stutzeri]MBA1280426.1 hypothetical protein [Stutzerimonas stutzeri]
MKKVVTFTVCITVDDQGELDEYALRKAISDGIDIAHSEGHLTHLDDESTEIVGWSVTYATTEPLSAVPVESESVSARE